MPLVLQPLPPEQLPAGATRVLGGPAPAKLMAARGFAPLRPNELALTLYQLSFDADEAVKKAAAAAPAALPDPVLLTPLREELPAAVLHWFASCLPLQRASAIEALLTNAATADETFVMLAGKALDRRAMDIMFDNEQRLLRCPAILEALYTNERAPMAQLNRAIELCVRQGIRLEAIPSYDEVARSIGEDPAAKDAAANHAFDELVQAAAIEQTLGDGKAPAAQPEPTAPTEPPAAAPPAPAAGEAEQAASPPAEEKQKKSAVIDYLKLKLHEKIRLATLGNYGVRRNLIRDANKLVALATIRSPRITEMEVVAAAGNKGLCEEVIRYIASQKYFMKLYSVKWNLVNNPKCPLATSMKLIPFLRVEDLRDLSKSKGIPSALAIQAKKMVATRTKT